MFKKLSVPLFVLLFFAAIPFSVSAQIWPTSTPVPATATSVPPTATPDTSALTTSSSAQSAAKGSIRGTIYQDSNMNGTCDASDKVLSGIPVRFVSQDGLWNTYLQSGVNGTYGLAAAGQGSWTVTVDAPAPWVAIGAKSQQVFISDTQLVSLNVNFCLTDVTAAGSGSGAGTIYLPQSGQSLFAQLLWPTMVALLLIIAGGWIEWNRRQNQI